MQESLLVKVIGTFEYISDDILRKGDKYLGLSFTQALLVFFCSVLDVFAEVIVYEFKGKFDS